MTVEAEFIPVLEEASRIFKETEPQEDFTLLGFVERLTRPLGSEKGEVSIRAIIDEKPRTVHVELANPEYEVALQAHRDVRPISFVGELIKEGRSYQLKNPRHVRGLTVEEEE